MESEQRDRIVQALRAEVSPLRAEGLRLAVEHVLAQPLGTVLDAERVRAVVLSALTDDNLSRIVARHLLPAVERYGVGVAGSLETVGDLVPEPEQKRIESIVHSSRLPEARWAQGMVDPVLVRKLLSPVWVHVLMSFAKRLPIPGGGGGSGVAGAASRGALGIAGRLTRSMQEQAEKLVDAGRSVMGGLGAEVERRFQAAAREFSDGAATVFREALVERLKSPEGSELAREIGSQVVSHVMKTRLAALHADSKAVPIPEILGAVPGIVSHARSRPFVQKIIDREVAAFLSVEGARPLRDVIGELGILDDVRAIALQSADALARGLASTDEFEAWVGQLLAL